MITDNTARVRILIIVTLAWVIILFNIERLNLLNVNIPTTLYVYVGFCVLSLLLLPITGQVRSVYMLFASVLLYAVLRFLHVLSFVPFGLLELAVECVIVTVTVWLGQQLSANLENVNMVIDEIIFDTKGDRILMMTAGEDAINMELFRARRYERPVVLVYIKMPSIRRLRAAYANTLQYQLSVEHRYLKARIARIVESLLYRLDPMIWYEDDLVICLPETDKDAAVKLSRQITELVASLLNLEIRLGVAEFPMDGLIYQDLVRVAASNLKVYRNADDDADDHDSAPPPPSNDDDVEVNDLLAITYPRRDLIFEPAQPTMFVQLKELAQWVQLLVFGDIHLIPVSRINNARGKADRLYHDPDYWVNRLPHQSAGSRIIYSYLKRAMDIVAVLITFPMLLIVGITIAFAIKLEDGGPIFYPQYRTGLGGRKFKMYKFRSMIQNADKRLAEMGVRVNERNETVNERGEKLTRDPRITKVGNIIRKTSLDEIPQLWNVLVGDMSLVGPRPTSFGIDKYQLFHTHRLNVLPGITGLWQIHDRGDTDFDNRLVWDIKYIDKFSLAIDLQILIRTVLTVARGRGAR